MQTGSWLRILSVFFVLSFSSFAHAQLSKKHFIPPLTSSEFGNANPEDQYLYISTPSNSIVPYTIIPVGAPITNYITGTVSNTTPQIESIGVGATQLFVNSSSTSTVFTNKGYIIEAEAPIYVSVRLNAGGGAQAGALVSKGLSALDTTFRIGTYTSENPQTNYLSFVSVMASEDNTVVTFSDLPSGLLLEGSPNVITVTGPISVTLNEGESYVVAINIDTNGPTGNGLMDGLIGCLVSSDKPIAVNCGSANGSFGNGGARDYGIDQIAGLSKIGNEYIFVRGNGNNDWENVLIVAHSDNTTISINGNAPSITINAGEYHVIEGNNYNAAGNMYVETSENTFAYQGIGSNSEANQGMFFVPPLSCETRGNIDNIPIIDFIGNTPYTENSGVSIVTKVGATVTINNQPLTVSPNNVTGKPDYITYSVTGLTGNVSVQGDDELYVAYFNQNGAATSGSFYSGFPTNPEINFDAQFATLGNCIPNITLEAANAQNFDSYEWFYDQGSGFQSFALNVPSITPTIPARYKLIGTITCTGETLESVEVPVSICPDDIDNDGIIDNIDVDNDNDGILNCTESRGDVVLDLSDTRPPRLRFQDGTVDTSIATDNITLNRTSAGTSAIRLTGTGNITSEIPQDSNGENIYNIVFTEPVNIKLSEDTSYTHTSVNGEYFIAKILPANKNITLVDPDNRLLVDSNFDGLFETGVTQISGSEIRFKYNPTPSGNTPYQFLANQVDGLELIHVLQNVLVTSTYQVNISLTCFKKDNDSDGIKDELDLDSDNDGLPDYIENLGSLVTLSGVDADFDGLDDIFDINVLPLDSDNDGVFDFYDLDSDNDGIYDLIEADPSFANLSDTDVNGIDDGPSFGINGWVDRAETSPDSNLIGYTPNDLDADSIFSYLDLDSDGDTCSDVIEAGFSDGNSDDLLGNILVTVDTNGLVTNASDGYTIPNPDYLNNAPIVIDIQPVNTTVCELSNTTISITSTTFDAIQWEISTDGITWNILVDNANYSGTQTNNLNILNTPLSFNTYMYRADLDRNGNGCGLYSDEIELTVNPLPIVNSPVVLIQCDDDIDGISFFNLTEGNDEITSNAINETFTYFSTQAGAITGDITSPDYIASPTTYENNTSPFSDVVWARIESQFGCASVSEIQLNVGTSQIPAGAINEILNQCDDFLDINGIDNANNDDRDGIATFDFSYVQAMVENFFLPQTPTVTFYRNESDALAENDAITNTSSYRNIGYPNTQQIYVRVDSQVGNDCQAFGPFITLNVEPLPVANPVTITRQCDDDNDGQFPFNTSQVESDLLGAQNPANVTVEYFDALNNPLPSPLPNPFLTASQTITIRVTNNTTSAPDGPCFDETTLEFIVDISPIANPVTDFIICDGDSGDIDDDGIYPFDTSNIESLVLGSQTGMDVFYTYQDENGNTVSNATSLPNPFISGIQTVTVDVVNPINTSCFASTNINFIVNPLPEFTIETPQIVCSSDPNFTVTLDPFELNNSEVFIYEWIDENGVSLSNDETLTVSTPGTYSITLTKTDGTNCSRTREVFVNASELATITQADITIVDISDNNTITINEANLGLGDYEYALDDEFSSYQDEPFFDRVRGGIHTIFVRDKKGCGTSSIEISVIDYPNYFTPNGDGTNDFWQILGINAQFQPQSDIYIFDRYGKLMKQLDPISNGWNGTFNGQLLPSDDYWFRVMLDDGREFKGHFSLKR